MNNTPLRIIYAGTPDFAAPALEKIIELGHHVVAVYTQPDRRAGRGRKVAYSPVKACALQHEITVMQPVSLKTDEAQQALKAFEADVMIVAAYGLLLPDPVLQAPKYGCLNIHASLLPRWRGAAPIQRAIAAGDSQSGVTIMQMDIGLDTGDMLLRKECRINENTTGQQLHDTLAGLGALALADTLPLMVAGKLEPVKQNNDQATYANKLDKQEAIIDWHDKAIDIHRRICAFNAWPVAQTVLQGDTLRVWESTLVDGIDHQQKPGCIVGLGDGLDIATGEGVVRLQRVQAPGKKSVAIKDFLNSRDLSIGLKLG